MWKMPNWRLILSKKHEKMAMFLTDRTHKMLNLPKKAWFHHPWHSEEYSPMAQGSALMASWSASAARHSRSRWRSVRSRTPVRRRGHTPPTWPRGAWPRITRANRTCWSSARCLLGTDHSLTCRLFIRVGMSKAKSIYWKPQRGRICQSWYALLLIFAFHVFILF